MDNLTAKYRMLFGTPQGQEVLTDILDSLGYFEPNEFPDNTNAVLTKQAMTDFAIALLGKCGVNDKRLVVQGLLNAYKPDEQDLTNEMEST